MEEKNGHIKAISKDAAHHEHERFVTFAMAVPEEMEPHLQLAEQDTGMFTSVISDMDFGCVGLKFYFGVPDIRK
ncbi:hypothetical protein EK904_007692 [Melospiza melodia maxima]|nr:hypothetical protein EK904_007692 [Melospiza melodia maxima]